MKKLHTKEQALQKLKQYCSYQERCHYEVEQKLWELGVKKTDHNEVISALIEEDYLNEERFAFQYAGGKFRMKDWGRKKIAFALREKRVSDYSIKKALKAIDAESYDQTLSQLTEKKFTSLKCEQHLVRRKKTYDYLLQKGFEPDLINEAMKKLREEK